VSAGGCGPLALVLKLDTGVRQRKHPAPGGRDYKTKVCRSAGLQNKSMPLRCLTVNMGQGPSGRPHAAALIKKKKKKKKIKN
jgi:hypothetical protein